MNTPTLGAALTTRNLLYTKNDGNRQTEARKKELDGRDPFRRDWARLIHSPCFRRLQGKTQLFPSDENDFFRNRLTHSMEVAQIASGIALNFNAHKSFFIGKRRTCAHVSEFC
jgi:dGTPase